MIAIGMDAHMAMSYMHAVASDLTDLEDSEFAETFNLTFRKPVTSNVEGLSKIADFLKDRDHCILIENSSKAHDVFWTLTDLGCTVLVANASDLYRINMSVKKTDAHDAAELAAYMRRRINGEDEFSACLMVDSKWMNRRQICRLYVLESQELSDCRRRLRSFMLLRGTVLDGIPKDISSENALTRLEECADESMRLLIERTRQCRGRMKTCLKSIEKEFADDEMYGLLISIPGFGPVISAYFSSMIVDIDRFPNAGCFSAYLGIVPKQRDSADSSPRLGITRRGDATARRLVFMSTMIHIYRDKDRASGISRRYDNHCLRMPKRKALVAASNKMARVVYGVLRSGTEYKDGF